MTKAEIKHKKHLFRYMKQTPYFKKWFASQFNKCKGICSCGKNMIAPISGRIMKNRYLATTDHIIPVSAGGTNRYSNLRLLCARCNSSKDSPLKLIRKPKGQYETHTELVEYNRHEQFLAALSM